MMRSSVRAAPQAPAWAIVVALASWQPAAAGPLDELRPLVTTRT